MPLTDELRYQLKWIRFPEAALRERAEALLAAPEVLNQDAFGICGMAAVVFIMLHTNPDGFVCLLAELFGGMRPLPEPRTMVDRDEPGLHQLEQYYNKRKPADATYHLDFLVCRYLTVLMERDAAELHARQELFTRNLGTALNGGGKDPLDMTQGNLAIHFDGMKWMCDRFLWAGRSKELKVSAAWPGGGAPVALSDVEAATKAHHVISAQTMEDTVVPPMFSHWVVLIDVAAKAGKVNAPVKWHPSEFSRGKIEPYTGIDLSEDEFRQIYPRMIMADT